MSKKKEKDIAKKRQKEEDEMKKAIKDHPDKPSRIAELGRFYLESASASEGADGAKLKRKAFDTFENAIKKYDELKFKKDKNGAILKLDRKEINQKCNLLSRLALLSKDVEILKTKSQAKKQEDDEDSEDGADGKLRSQVDQVYYLLRAENAYKEEANDKDMAARVAS